MTFFDVGNDAIKVWISRWECCDLKRLCRSKQKIYRISVQFGSQPSACEDVLLDLTRLRSAMVAASNFWFHRWSPNWLVHRTWQSISAALQEQLQLVRRRQNARVEARAISETGQYSEKQWQSSNDVVGQLAQIPVKHLQLNTPLNMMRHLQPSIADDQPLVTAARKRHPLPTEFLLLAAANRMNCYQLLNMAMRLL